MRVVLGVGLIMGKPEGVTEGLDGGATVEGVGEDLGVEVQWHVGIRRLQGHLTASLGVE